MAATRQRGWWYPYIFVGLFAIVVGVNVTMAYFATSTFTGLETESAYQKGLEYNTNLALARQQEALGWTVETTVTPVTGQGPRAEIVVSYRDRDGKPVDGMEVGAKMIRPTSKGLDHKITLKPLGNGTYGGAYQLPVNGVWDMDIVALGADAAYEHAHRFVIK
jgi:nitrogen fixation protein FixH